MTEKLRRLLRLLTLLQTGRATVDSLSVECGVHRRTVLRDIGELRRCGVPVHYDTQQKRYSTDNTLALPETQFTLQEALAMITLCYEFGDRNHLPFFHSAKTAAVKLQSLLPPELGNTIQNIGSAIRIQPTPANPMECSLPHYETILRGMQNRRMVRVTYQGPVESEFTTGLHPYQLVFIRRSWYVIGRSTLHRAVRTFNIGRMTNVEETETTYRVPAGFTLKRYFRNAWCMIPEPGPDQEIVIRFSPKVAQNVSEILWHPTQRIFKRDDGGIDFCATVSGLNEISWWILGYGKEAEVREPKELREMIRKHAEVMLQRYSD